MATKKPASRKGSFRAGPPGGARPALNRKTYYLTDDLVMRLKIRAATDHTDQSTVVRDALERHLKTSR